MIESIYMQVKDRIREFQITIDKYYNDDNEVQYVEQTNPLTYTFEFDQLKKEYPDPEIYRKYLIDVLERYEWLKSLFVEPDKSANQFKRMNIDLLLNSINQIIKYLKGLINPETETQEQPQKFEKLKPIEKILIVHYLKIDSLKPISSQLHISTGINFISRLFDINQSSIRDAVKKIANYTTDDNTGKLPKIEAKTANQYIPILKNVKSFFEKSDLISISEEVGKRIEVLNEISGKNF